MPANTNGLTPAPGGPGVPPRWTRGSKEAVGTAYSSASRVWYTIAAGILTEVFYPTIDTPQIRDLQFLVTDGETFFHDERRNTRSRIDCVDDAALGFTIVNVAENDLYTIDKTVIGHPHQDCVLMRTRFAAAPDVLRGLQVYVLCAPHLEIGGWHNNAEVLDTKGGRILCRPCQYSTRTSPYGSAPGWTKRRSIATSLTGRRSWPIFPHALRCRPTGRVERCRPLPRKCARQRSHQRRWMHCNGSATRIRRRST